MRLAAQAKGGYYPTPMRVVDLLAELIDSPPAYGRPGQTLRVLDPCCGGGDALAATGRRLCAGPTTLPVETYGVELHRDRAEEAQELLDRALACDLFATSIANGVFGVLLLNPPYDYDSEDKRTEHAFLDPLHPVPGRRRPAGVHRTEATPRGLGPLPGLPLPGPALLVLSRNRSGKPSTRWY